MNSKLLLCALSLISFSAFAAPGSKSKMKRAVASTEATDASSTTTSTMSTPSSTGLYNFSPKGVRFSLFKPVLTMKEKVSGQKPGETSLDNTFGLSVGYVNLPYKQLGWAANASYIEIFEAGEKFGVVRADANVGYGFEKNLNIKGGLNLSKFIIPGRIRDSYNPNFGVQASAGLQVTKYVGVDVGYTHMKQTNANEEVLLSGLEIGLNGTF